MLRPISGVENVAILYVARSQSLQKWAADVGLTKHVYLVGISDDSAEDVIGALNGTAYAGRADWKLVKQQGVEALDPSTVLDRIGRKEKLVDPSYYPQIKGASGIVKVNLANAEDHILMTRALAGELPKLHRITPADIAAYLFRLACG
jgi:hypothetical protein